MKASDILSGIVHLFNDLIGTVIPGALLISGFIMLNVIPQIQIDQITKFDASLQWFLMMILSYVAGHLLLSLHRMLQPNIGTLFLFLDNLLNKFKCSVEGYEEKIQKSESYNYFKKMMEDRLKNKFEAKENTIELNLTYSNVRNMAMTISKEAGDLARRFMFISLLCYGASMAFFVLGIVYLVNSFSGLGLIMTLFVIFALYVRGIEFEFRAQNVPFSVAMAEFIIEKTTRDIDEG